MPDAPAGRTGSVATSVPAGQIADAIAYAIFNVAASTEAVNGVAGVDAKGTTPDEVDFDGPQGTFLGGGGMSSGHGHAVD